jgi:PPIC-type PPIASE domain
VFAVAGSVLFLVYSLLQPDDSAVVRLTTRTRTALIAEFESLTGRKASPGDIARIERDYVTDELLFRDAVANGLHLTDSAVRGRLIEDMRLQVAGVLPDPSDEQLVNHYSDNIDRYRSEPSVTFAQVHFRTRPDNDEEILALLRAGTPVAGDAFPQGREFPRFGLSMLRGIFGQPFVDTLWSAPLGQWIGPIESPRGWHFVRATERVGAELLPFGAVRDQVENDYLAAAIQQAIDRRVAELERRYTVTIDQ